MVDKFIPRFRGLVPLVFDDTLTYYEQLCYIAKKLNELIDEVNNIDIDIDNKIDTKVNALKVYVDDENNKQNVTFKTEIDNLTDYINNALTELYNLIIQNNVQIKLYVTNEIEKLKKYIDNYVVTNIYVYDPTTGYKNPLGVVINNIYEALRYYGITAQDFDYVGMTCKQYDDKHMNAIIFDTKSAEIIGKLYHRYIFNPITGFYETIQNVLYSWFQEYRNDAIQCFVFDNLNKTCDTIDTYDYTAFMFDSDAINILI